MKFTVQIDGRREELEVVRHREGSHSEVLRITREGQTTDVRVVHRDGPQFVLEIEERQGDHMQRRRLRAAGDGNGERRQLWVNGSNVHYEIVSQGSTAAGGGPAGAGPGGGLSASIPAVVSEILVATGDRVNAGQKLILLESMKMILPIQSPRAGIVAAIHCQVGEAVQPGSELIELGELEPED